MTTIANLEVLIGADISDFKTALNTVKSSLTNVSGNVAAVGVGIKRAGAGISNFGSNLSNVVAPLNSIVTGGLDVASAFQDTMIQLETFGGLAGDELETVRELAIDLGEATKFSATDAANAMLELVKGGMSVEEAMEAASTAMDMAAVGNMSLEQAAGIVSSTLAQFGIDASKASEATDAITAAALASRADVRDLAEGLANVGPVAERAGLRLDETAAVLGVFADNGIMGAEAGTQLKSLLLNMNSDTAQKAFEQLGLKLYTAEGQTRDFDTVLDELNTALSTLSPEEQTRLMKDLAGSYGISGLAALLAAGGIDTMLGKMEAAPDAATLAQDAMSTFSGKVDSLKGSVETLMINALTPLMDDVLAPLTEDLTEIVNAVGDWAKENPELAKTLGAIVTGAAGVAGVAVILGPIISGLGTVVGALGVAFGVATAPLGLLALGIGGLILLLNNEDIQKGLKAWEGVFQNFAVIADAAIYDVQVGIAGFVRDLEATLLDIQSKAAAAQIVLGINVEANEAFVTEAGSQLQFMDIAKQLEDSVAGYLAGNPVNLDIGGLNWAITGEPDPTSGAVAPAEMAQSIIDSITDPRAIQAALDMAIASSDAEAVQAFLPVALELAEDPTTQMQELLTTALDVGGENSPVFAVLAATATELDIDVADVTAQYDAALKEAAAAQTFNIEVIANVRVRTADIDMSGVQQAVTMGPAAPPANVSPLVPKLAVGGYIQSSGLAYVHAGEVVLNKQQQQEASMSEAKPNVTYVINAYGQTPLELAQMLKRALQEGNL